METSRKRFSENDGQGNKRKSRKYKTKPPEEKIVGEEESMDCQDADKVFVNVSNDSAITLQLIQTCSQPYNNEDDKKIIKYFKGNMNLLNMKDDLSVYHVLKAKYFFQKSAISLQSRFLNDILPNLFKYNVLNNSDMIDFYDAAKLELPEEFVKILDDQEATNKKSNNTCAENDASGRVADAQSSTSRKKCNKQEVTKKENISIQNENIAVPNTFRKSNKEAGSESSTSKQKCNKQKVTNKENISVQNENIAVTDKPRQSESRTELASDESSTSEEKCLKSILDFILLNNSKGNCVCIPDTEPNISSVEKRLLDEFGIQQDSIKIVPKINFDKIKELKDTFDIYKKLEYDVLKNRIHDEKFIERMFPDVRKLLEFMEKSKRPSKANELLNLNLNLNENQFPVNNEIALVENERTSETSCLFNSIFNDIEIDNMGQLIDTLSDSFDYVSISSNIENQEHNSADEKLEEIKMEPVDQDDIETVVRSPYFGARTYTKNNNKNVTNTETNSSSIKSVGSECTTDLKKNNVTDMESNLRNISLIDSACIPQIMFSKRCKDKIVNENINVDHLIIKCVPKNDETPTLENCNEQTI